MKKKTLICVTFLLVFVGMQVSCKERSEAEEIPFTEYSLIETGCNWINFKLDKVYLINSKQTLLEYIACDSGNIPIIDFDNYSLIFASAYVPGGIAEVDKTLSKIGNQYFLEANVLLDYTGIAGQQMFISILVNKLNTKNNIELNIITKR